MPDAVLAEVLGRLAVATGAGVGLRRAWTSETNRVPSTWRPAMEQVADALTAGLALVDALDAAGDAFPPLVRGMLAAGAETGREPETCRDLAALLQRSARHAGWMRRVAAGLPGIGARRWAELAVWCRVVAMAVGTGIDVGRAVAMGSSVAPGLTLDAEAVRARLRSGRSLSETLRETGQFPLPVVEAVAVGEMTGKVAEMLDRMAVRCDDEATRRFHRAARVAAWTGWAAFALAVVIVVFRVFMAYLAILQDAGRPI